MRSPYSLPRMLLFTVFGCLVASTLSPPVSFATSAFNVRPDPAAGPAPLTVSFGCAVPDTAPGAVEYFFDFGDGSFESSSRGYVAHTYLGAGEFLAVCTAFHADGSSTVLEPIEIRANLGPSGCTYVPEIGEVCEDPVVSAFSCSPASGNAPLQVDCTCSGYDPYGSPIVEYVFRFDDGTSDIRSDGQTSHTYAQGGSYTATCSVRDSDDRTSVPRSFQIQVGSWSVIYDGIWKDAGLSMNFYIQSYVDGSALILATPDLTEYYVFIDADIQDGIDVSDYAGMGHHLSVTFTDGSHGNAVLTRFGSPATYVISRTNGLGSTPANHGIWKSPSCGAAQMNYYVQTYDTGSAVAIGTSNLADYYVFLDSNAADGIDADELGGKPYHLTMSFSGSGTAGMDSLERCVEAPFSGSPRPTQAWSKFLQTSPPDTFTNSLGMTFKYIPPGTFTMGSPTDEPGRDSDETQHQVTLTQGYYLQTTEITQGQWKAVMGSNPSSFSSCGDDCPVESVSWDDVQDFVAAMNQLGEGTYRLPTEAEWECAARAGSTTAFANGGITETVCGYDPNLYAMGWYCHNSGDMTHPVAQKAANAWGLYDMHGNVWEWVEDWFGDYPSGSVTDPTGPASGSYRVLRGGGWYYYAGYCRSANRGGLTPDVRGGNLGARLLRSYP